MEYWPLLGALINDQRECAERERGRERESTLTMDLDSKRFVRIDKHGVRGRQLFSEQATNRLLYPLS